MFSLYFEQPWNILEKFVQLGELQLLSVLCGKFKDCRFLHPSNIELIDVILYMSQLEKSTGNVPRAEHPLNIFAVLVKVEGI